MSAFEDWFYENSWFSNYTDKEKIDFKQCWNAAIEHAEALKPSHNTAQPAILELVGRYCDAEDLTIDLRGEVVRFAKWAAQEQQAGA